MKQVIITGICAGMIYLSTVAGTAAASAQQHDFWDRLIADNPEVAGAFADGADPAGLVLADGTTLAQIIDGAAPGKNALVYTPVAPCRLVRTATSAAGILAADSSRHFVARTEAADLTSQGGQPTGCGIPATAEAILVLARAINPSASGVLQARAYAPGPFLRLVEFTTGLTPPRFANATILSLCVPQAACAFAFTLRPNAMVHAEVYVAGYFSPPPAQVGPSFEQLASGTNTSAAMVVGGGASLSTSGSGTIAASTAASATALATDGSNCPAGQWASGVDLSGNSQGCTAAGIDHSFGRDNDNTRVGRYALTNVSLLARDNTAIGHLTLSNLTSGHSNTAIGSEALANLETGDENTSFGRDAASQLKTGYGNTTLGTAALLLARSGNFNTAIGYETLWNTDGGSFNTAVGEGALRQNKTGSMNTVLGTEALYFNSTGSRNVAIGLFAGNANSTGSDNIFISHRGFDDDTNLIRIGTAGTHTRTYIAGIRGVTTSVADAVLVYVDSAGQLGTISSSRRYKEEVHDMGGASERLLDLRPVTFRFKEESASGRKPIQFGLIAEEVAEVFPELVVYSEEGKPEMVKYHLLSSLLLNELRKQRMVQTRLLARVRSLEQMGIAFSGLAARVIALEQKAVEERQVGSAAPK